MLPVRALDGLVFVGEWVPPVFLDVVGVRTVLPWAIRERAVYRLDLVHQELVVDIGLVKKFDHQLRPRVRVAAKLPVIALPPVLIFAELRLVQSWMVKPLNLVVG